MARRDLSKRDSKTLSSSDRLLKDKLSKVHYYKLSQNIVKWEDLDPKIIEEFERRTSSEQYKKDEAERAARIEAKKQKEIERKKIRVIEW